MGFNSAVISVLTLNLLTTTIVAPPSNASKWQMGFNSAFKGLTKVYLLTTIIVAPPSNARKWQMGFNLAFKGLTGEFTSTGFEEEIKSFPVVILEL